MLCIKMHLAHIYEKIFKYALDMSSIRRHSSLNGLCLVKSINIFATHIYHL